MKKLMTMLAAVATAFGLFAADTGFISGAGFDTSDTTPVEGTTNMTWTTPAGFDLGYWTGVTTETAVWTDGTSRASDNTDRPARFLQEDDLNRKYDGYLTLNTGTGLVSANILSGGDAQTIGTDGLYFDGLVQFTSFEDAPAITNDAKIAVFPMVDDPDDDTLTSSLWISAAGNETNLWKTTETIDDGWHRVTIKMINNILTSGSQVGFVVYIDGNPIGTTDAVMDDANLTSEAKFFNKTGHLFGALTGTAEMTDVAFSGKGAIDEIAFTETAPDFAASPIFCTLTGATGIASFVADGLTWTNGGAAVEAEIKSGSVSVTGITAAEGYFIPTGAESTNFTGVAKNDVLTVEGAKALGATVEIAGQDPQYFESAAAALVELNKVEAATTAKLTLNAGSGAITVNNALLAVTLDLAGYTVDGAITLTAGALTIDDSSELQTGTVKGAVNTSVMAGAGLTINAGIYDGTVSIAMPTPATINNGKFEAAANATTFTLLKEKLNPSLSLDLVLEGGYYVVKAITDFKVNVPAKNENTTLAVTIDDVEVGTTNGTYTVAKASTLVATYTAANEGYDLVGQGVWTVTYATKDTVITAPTATIKTFTVTFNPNNGGENIVSNNVPYNTAFDDVKPENPTKTGYTFTGWSPAAAPVTADATYTAQYEEILVTAITLDKSSVTIYVGGTSNVVATIVPDTALTKTVTWDYTALEGYATAVAEGNTLKITGTVAQPVSSSPMVIKAKVGAVEATCDVFVVPVPTAGPTTDTPGAEVEEQDLPGGKVAVVTTTDSNVKAVTLSGLGANTTVQVNGQIDSISGLGEGNNIIVKSRAGTAYDITAFCKIDRSGGTATISLDPAKATPVIGEVTIDDKPVAPVSADGTVGFQTKPGLYYTLIAGNEPGAVTVEATEQTLATGEAMTLTADPAKFTPTGAKAFFKVEAAK